MSFLIKFKIKKRGLKSLSISILHQSSLHNYISKQNLAKTAISKSARQECNTKWKSNTGDPQSNVYRVCQDSERKLICFKIIYIYTIITASGNKFSPIGWKLQREDTKRIPSVICSRKVQSIMYLLHRMWTQKVKTNLPREIFQWRRPNKKKYAQIAHWNWEAKQLKGTELNFTAEIFSKIPKSYHLKQIFYKQKGD